MFTLAISSLTTSNLSIRGPNIPGSYAILFLQHCTLLPLTVTAKTGHCVHFGSAFLFFLELFLHSSPVAYWTPTYLRVHLSVSYLFPFSYCSQVRNSKVRILKVRILKWFAIPFSRGRCFVRILHHDTSILGGPTWHGSWFH